jgi:hypothetical protein
MRTADQWLPDLRRMVDVVRHDPPHIGVLSRGEQCAVALVLDMRVRVEGNDIDLIPGWTALDCMNRIEPELLEACIKAQRELA